MNHGGATITSTRNLTFQLAQNPLSPPSAPVQRRLQGPPAKSKFLAVRRRATDELVHEQLDGKKSFVIYHEYVQRLRQDFRPNQAAV